MAVDMVRRPSPAALDRALLEKLQRKVEVLVGKHHMLGTVDVQMDGVRSRMVDHYNMKHALCKEAALAPLHVRVLRNGCPQALQVQLKRLHIQPQQQRQQESSAVGIGNAFSLTNAFRASAQHGEVMSFSDMLPWKAAMHLLPKADFAMGVDLGDDTRATVARVSVLQPPLAAAAWKWGRNGRSRLRYVVFDEAIEAVAWKSRETDRVYHGAIPLAKIQDICSGIKTPLLKRVKNAQLQPECAWSVVALDRTLDLQADSPMLQTR
eukprot:CAMPEP_0115367486 /NCGR_PEP_ID=MMETSP0270-20121206/105339_1 /TAXON_ID=71861 /ORGANISM="Scrippsiella trochoidea, Strain CCMP3099" /LENGTH=264 /DNA_ID=CAMNT_0002790277 /DNA_START=32 /DNA_END=822 /DNA_ORIENTATION=-